MTTIHYVNPNVKDSELWKQDHTDSCPCGDCPTPTLLLIREYELAQVAYDEALVHAFAEKDENKALKLTDEQCKLYARQSIRKQGFKSLQTYDWLLQSKLK